jgi:hypothetical protein
VPQPPANPAEPNDPAEPTEPTDPTDTEEPEKIVINASDIATTIRGEVYTSVKQPDGSFLLTLPNGTDISAVKLNIKLPAGASIAPDISAPVDFSTGSVTFTVTASDGTKSTIKIAVHITAPEVTSQDKSGGSGGGCGAGNMIFALLMLTPVVLLKKRV